MGNELNLDEFLCIIFSPRRKELFPNNSFPTNEMLNEYCSTVENRTDDEVRELLRFFLVPSGNYGSDFHNLTFYLSLEAKQGKGEVLDEYLQELLIRVKKTEYYRRLLRSMKRPNVVWEGISWVLELLPRFAKEAVEGIDCYFLANCHFLPDYALSGLSNATTIITAKYLDRRVPREIFLSLEPIDFEYLVQELFEKMGYGTKSTSKSNDEGIDIICEKLEPGNKQYVLVQCKRYYQNVGVPYVRDLIGVVTDKKATKGILVSSSIFTKPAKTKAFENPSIELIDYHELTKLLNRYVDPLWPVKINSILLNRKRTL